jgi:multidrug resistance efflux pump
MLRPHESECVAAYCRRAFQMQEDLANANRAVADVAMVEAVLDGFKSERPEWAVVLQGLQPGLTGRETVADIQPDLVRLEVRVKMQSEPQAAAARANNKAHAESELQALKAQVEQLSAQLRTLEPRPRRLEGAARASSSRRPHAPATRRIWPVGWAT